MTVFANSSIAAAIRPGLSSVLLWPLTLYEVRHTAFAFCRDSSAEDL